ncbi:MAG TPA: metallophosphoesterase [Candidatus Thermoplasmatota archaeon]|nr:metallophosphoesterase [Candidatus Thermoplasmatota archaeon]
MRIAAVADLHCRTDDGPRIRRLAEEAAAEADILVLPGDLTDHGRVAEMEALLHGLNRIDIPVVAVFGNHDHETGQAHVLAQILRAEGIHVLDRSSVTINGVGFAGVKGFAGGFDNRLLRSFGEIPLKSFVQESVEEAASLRRNLKALDTDTRVAVLHYAPTRDTVVGESPEIFPFLGTSRLGDAIDDGGATLALHGHAHGGSYEGKTPGGTRTYNVSLPVLKKAGFEHEYSVFEI